MKIDDGAYRSALKLGYRFLKKAENVSFLTSMDPEKRNNGHDKSPPSPLPLMIGSFDP